MRLLSFISDHLLLCVFLSLLWGTTDSSAANTSTVTAQIVTTTTQKTTLPTSTTQSSTSLAPTTTTTKSPPVNVQNVTVKMQNETSITLQWKKVSNTDTYIIEYNGRKITVTDSADVVIYTVLNLTDGTRYNFSLFAVFDSVRSSGVNYTTVTAPRSINVVTVVRRNETSISLQWEKVNNISTYILQYNYNSSAVGKNISVSQEGPVGYVVSPLTAGTIYSFTLFTVLEGVSSSGYTFNAVTVPENVQNVIVNAQNQSSISLQWDKVNNIPTYILQYNYNGRAIVKNINVSQEGPVGYVVSSLTAGTIYSFTLFTVLPGVNSSGYTFNAVTVPGNFQNVIVKARNETSISLQWDKVNKISTYILQYVDNGSVIRKNISEPQEGPVGYVVSPLTAGTIYSFTLFTVLQGVSSSGYTFSHVTVPENVQKVIVKAQNESSISLQWDKVNNISTYTLQYNDNGSAIVKNISVSQEGPIGYVVSPLTAGTIYSFTLFTVLQGVSSSGYTFSAVTVPENVQKVIVKAQNESSISLQWDKVNNISTYTLQYNDNGSAIVKNISVSQEGPVGYVVSSLTAGTIYSFTLFTVLQGVSSSGYTFSAVTAPGNVQNVTLVAQTNSSITLTWGKVYNISTYILQYNYNGSAVGKNISVSQEGPIGYVVSPLTAGTNYSFTLFTVLQSISSSGYTFNAVTAPCDAGEFRSIDQTETSITLQWKQVSNTDTYIIEFNDRKIHVPAPAGVITYTVLDLTHGTRYNFNLFAVFENVRSSGVNYTAVTVPPMVSSVNVTDRSANSITLNWENMNEAWEYLLQISGSPFYFPKSSSNIVTKVVTSLKPGTEYSFTLTTMFSGLNSTAYSNFTVTAIDCASADWTVTNSSIKGKIEGLFSNATASNGSHMSVSPEGENVSFTDLYPGATYEISLFYEKSALNFLQCQHKLTVLPPNLNAHCEYWAAGYSVLVAWNEPYGEWTAVEVNVSGKSLTKNRSENKVEITGFQPAKQYKVSVTSLSGSVRSSEPHVFYCQSDPRGVIAGSVFAVLLFGLLVALVVFIFLKRPHIISRRKSFIGGSKVSSTKSKAISAAKFPDHFHQLCLDDNRGFNEEYEGLAPVGTDQTRKTAILPENKAKNRFTNVLPYDWCRVKLTTLDPNRTSDYINANYMPGYNSNREYIATQGPLPSTVNDFWRMIWEQRVKRIVMVTNCTEGGRTKCEQYWPADRKPCPYGELQVTVRSEQHEPNWTLREFSLKDRKTSEERTVKHFHFTAWPDHGVPLGTEVLIQFRGLMRQHIEREGGNAPTVIHCSAGVGRTGTIIALDVLLQQLERDRAVGINAFVHKMRLNRPYMVQTESQYVFLHQCIMDSLQPKETNEENVYENADVIYANATALQELHRHNANA